MQWIMRHAWAKDIRQVFIAWFLSYTFLQLNRVDHYLHKPGYQRFVVHALWRSCEHSIGDTYAPACIEWDFNHSEAWSSLATAAADQTALE